MALKSPPLPQWTWEDLEAALDAFSPMGANDPVRSHLLRGLADDAEQSSPRELLRQVLRGVRLLILLVIVVVTAVMMKAVADLVLAYAGQAQEIGEATAF